MKGFVKHTVAGLILGAGLASAVGCLNYRKCVDPCWPERYNAQARQTVHEGFNAQADNGHILDQTVWEYHFEKDKTGAPTEKLSAGGMEHLKYLARRRPFPDARVYLQTAQDIRRNLPPEKLVLARA